MSDVEMSKVPNGIGVAETSEQKGKKRGSSTWSRFVRNKLSLIGFIILVIMVLVAILAPVLATYDYQAIDPINANQFPSAAHWFGTDNYGRDIWSRMVYGARYSLAIGISSQALALCIGIILGAIAGYLGGTVDNVILRCCDIFQSIPATLLAIVISQALGSGFFQTTLALSVSGIAIAVRMLRATMLTVRNQEFVEAARAIDCSSARIMFRHILPNSLSPMIITTSLGIGHMIMSSAGLSYLGLGIQEPAAEWGAMLALGKGYMRYYPFQVIIPGIAIALIVLAFNLIGDGLRDALDPKLKS
ncbi:MAG: ABC transporter permease [Oscillospiraceae bacterium]|nr:ABC transporter permease [Oscillospiraceae bacterium]MCD8389023.1 ABC transporter permease [Oscillospiraceae bacterium]